MPEIIASYQTSAFAVPVNGTPDDADQVRGNDNTLRSALNNHDADGGVHFQSSPLATRPAAGSLGRKWLASDTGRVYFDDGSNWQEIAYAPIASPNFTGTVSVAGSITINGGVLTTPSVIAIGNLTITAAAASNLSLGAGGSTRMTIIPTGHLQPNANNSYDLGTSTAANFRDLYLGGQITLGNAAQAILSTTFLKLSVGGVATQSVGPRKTGYTNPMTGTADRATLWDTATITLAQLAQRVKALTDDLHSNAGHGMIGP